MKIGIVSSGNDTLALWKILTKYDHEYFIYHHQLFYPFGSKDFAFMIEEIKNAVFFLIAQGVDKVIVDPIYELALRSLTPPLPYILPLYTTYLQDYAFKYSLVGKI
jgi:hypothetical protein